MLEHGGRLAEVAEKYQIPLSEWLDLSTGINPVSWPVPDIPPELWQHLPYNDDTLEAAADKYYGGHGCLAVAGSQAAIQALPHLRSHCRVGMLPLTYSEHAHAWQRNGHEVIRLQTDDIDQYIANLDVLLIVNPNNPTAEFFDQQQLLYWHEQLAHRGGWLIIDEAFMDATPEKSLVAEVTRPGLIVLSSLGKFFGLAGARCGFVFCDELMKKRLAEWLGPWTVAGPSRWVATQALQDHRWQAAMRDQLLKQSKRLQQLLSQYEFEAQSGSALFQWLKTPDAKLIQDRMAQQGIWIRRFENPDSLRFGLPEKNEDWLRLELGLEIAMSYSVDQQIKIK